MGRAVTEQDRIATLRGYDILDTPDEAQFDAIAQIVAQFFRTPIALVSLVDSDRQWFKARVGMDARETSRASSFCTHAIRSDEVMLVPDASLDPRFVDHPAVLTDPYVRFYAGAPLKARNGANVGTLCVADTKPRSELPPAAIAFLASMARRTVEAIELRSEIRTHFTHWPPKSEPDDFIQI